MTCKCGKECAGVAFAPKTQDWEYGTPRSPYLVYEVCEHGAVTVDNRPQGPDMPMRGLATGGMVKTDGGRTVGNELDPPETIVQAPKGGDKQGKRSGGIG